MQLLRSTLLQHRDVVKAMVVPYHGSFSAHDQRRLFGSQVFEIVHKSIERKTDFSPQERILNLIDHVGVTVHILKLRQVLELGMSLFRVLLVPLCKSLPYAFLEVSILLLDVEEVVSRIEFSYGHSWAEALVECAYVDTVERIFV